MIEGEYLHHFIWLFSFAQELIDIEAKKVNSFLKGLKPMRYNVTALMRLATYDDPISKPCSSEEDEKIQQSKTK